MRSGSHERSLPGAPPALPAGHARRVARRRPPPTRATDARPARPRAAARAPPPAALRFAIVNDEVTPTWCSAPACVVEAEQQRADQRPGPFLCQRKPATTQSAVRACLILIIARLPGWYRPSRGLAITPSRPAPSKRASQSTASSRSRVIGVRWIGGADAARAGARGARAVRLTACCRRSSPSAASRSKATNDAGVSFASFATRDAAGCRRSCSASKSRPCGVAITISPSTTQPSGSAAMQRLVQLREVAVERPQVAALDVRPRRRRGTRWRESRPTWARRASRRPSAARRRASRASARSAARWGNASW